MAMKKKKPGPASSHMPAFFGVPLYPPALVPKDDAEERADTEKKDKRLDCDEAVKLLKKDIQHLPFFVEKLLHANLWATRRDAAHIMKVAADKGVDISPAVSALIKTLSSDEPNVVAHSIYALDAARKRNISICRAIPRLVGLTSDFYVRESSISLLAALAKDGHREKVVKRVMRVLNSKQFLREAEDNSIDYREQIDGFGALLEALEEAA